MTAIRDDDDDDSGSGKDNLPPARAVDEGRRCASARVAAIDML